MSFLNNFRRITTTGDYFPEIDGLRFLAIFLVLLFHSTNCMFNNPLFGFGGSLDDYYLLKLVFGNGFQGVELFFAISGFILGYPFAKHYLGTGKKVGLKNYLMRRLTRLEPPYLLAMTAFFFILIIKGDFTFGELLPSYGASVIYMHFIIFSQFPLITMIAWSLEIEVQFYLLAPLIAKIYKLKTITRRLLLLGVIIAMTIIQWYFHFERVTIYQFIQFFLCGILLADYYALKEKYRVPTPLSVLIGTISLAVLLLVSHEKTLAGGIIYPLAIIVFYYLVLNDEFWKKIFSNKLIATIGGMCYSIYLLHFPLMSLITQFSHYYRVSDYFIPNLIVNTIVTVALSVIVSSVFFLLIEKPCMDRNWPQKLLRFFKSRKIREASC